jgi:hypothetical protein
MAATIFLPQRSCKPLPLSQLFRVRLDGIDPPWPRFTQARRTASTAELRVREPSSTLLRRSAFFLRTHATRAVVFAVRASEAVRALSAWSVLAASSRSTDRRSSFDRTGPSNDSSGQTRSKGTWGPTRKSLRNSASKAFEPSPTEDPRAVRPRAPVAGLPSRKNALRGRPRFRFSPVMPRAFRLSPRPSTALAGPL